MDEITTLQADVLRTLASPRRLEILHRLAAGPCEVGRLARDLGLSQPSVSQHLAVLRGTGVVEADRDGREVRYRLPGWRTSRHRPRRARRSRTPDPSSPPLDIRGRFDMDESINLVLFSGTDDKLQAAAVLTAGAAALGKPVHIFLQYWALDAFRTDRIARDHGLAPEAGPAGRAAVDDLTAAGQAPWAETLRQAKDLGGVDIQACSLSMDLLKLESNDLDPLVDGVEGVTSFYLTAGEGQVVFI